MKTVLCVVVVLVVVLCDNGRQASPMADMRKPPAVLGTMVKRPLILKAAVSKPILHFTFDCCRCFIC